MFPAALIGPTPQIEDPVAREILDDDGVCIGYCIVPGRLADNQRFLEAAWSWYDEFGVTDRSASAGETVRRLRLI